VWPFDPGASPFRIKGNAYRGHLEYVRQELTGGEDAMLAALPAAQRAFWSQSFLPTSYYDIHPLVASAAPCARLARTDTQTFLETRTRWQARYDVRGAYGFFARMLGRLTLASLVPRAIGLYFEFVRPEVLRDGDSVLVQMHGIPLPIAGWFATMFSSYADELFVLQDADSRFTLQAPIPAEPAHGVRTVTLPFVIDFG